MDKTLSLDGFKHPRLQPYMNKSQKEI
jgi:hypothetical protein